MIVLYYKTIDMIVLYYKTIDMIVLYYKTIDIGLYELLDPMTYM
jgi:hypothetical protein